MSSPRRLTFAVGSSLLTASLSLATAGCNKGHTVNVAPPPDDGGAQVDEGEEHTVNSAQTEVDEDTHVNPGPDEDPAPEVTEPEAEPQPTSNPAPEPE